MGYEKRNIRQEDLPVKPLLPPLIVAKATTRARKEAEKTRIKPFRFQIL
jgi:hypothetical protein